MKRQLFGQLGEKIKGRGVARAMLACVALAGIFCYGTVKNINERLERQRQQNIARQQEKNEPKTPDETVETENKQDDVPVESKPVTPPKAESEREAQPRRQEKFLLPAEGGKIYGAFSGDELVYNRTLDDWRTHNGVDIRTPKGDRVRRGAAGTVTAVYDDGLLGTVVEIEHDGFTARYCGLDKNTPVKAGDTVTRGQTIGTAGEVAMEVNDESHIHLEIIKDGKYVNPDQILGV